jgi:hypothetical protein
MLSRAHVRVEAKLSKDVYSAGEAVNVHVVMHSTGKHIPVRKIRAEAVQLISVCNPPRRQRTTFAVVVQYQAVRKEINHLAILRCIATQAVKNNRVLLTRHYVVDAAKLKPASWLPDVSKTEDGVLVEKWFTLLPRANEKLSCAHQELKDGIKSLCPSLLVW